MIPAFVTPTTADFTTGLIHHWPMTDAQVSGLTVNDIGSSPENFFIAGAVTSAAGPNATYPQGRENDGVANSYMSESNDLYDWTNAHSVGGWIYVDNLAATYRAQYDELPGGNVWIDFGIAGTSGKPFFRCSIAGPVSGEGVVSTTDGLSAGTWTHVFCTNTGGAAGTKLIYIGGNSIAVTTQSGLTGFNVADTHYLSAGQTADNNLDGRMASWRVYNRVLTSVDVSALFAAGG